MTVPSGSGPPTQLAVFQQLAQASNAGPIGTVFPNQRNPVSVSVVPALAPTNVPPVAPPNGAHAQNLPFRDDRNGFTRREPQYDRSNGPHRGRDSYDHRDHRGTFRGRGRGRGRWEERERQHERNRGGDWSAPPGRNTRSRSRSPGGRNGRNARPHSPPRKPAFYSSSPSQPRSVPSAEPDTGKDEFGRDLRPSVDSPASVHPTELSPSRSASIPVEDQTALFLDEKQEDTASTSASLSGPLQEKSTLAHTPTPAPDSVTGLDTFDLATFNPTDAGSWEALGKAWSVSHGYMPSQEELMQHVMSVNIPDTFPIETSYSEEPVIQWSGRQDDSWSQGNSRQRGRGYRGSFGGGHDYSDVQGGYRGRGRSWNQDTDALTLVGGDEPVALQQSLASEISDAYDGQQQHDHPGFGSVGKSGKMQRVGDKWVFVKAGEAEVV